MVRPRNQQVFAGTALIVLGLALYGLKFFGDLGQSTIFFLIGGAFLAAYLYRRDQGYLIPGCLILGYGVGTFGERSFFADGQASLLGLGLGFVMIAAVMLLVERRLRGWPLIPGGVLILLGIPNTGPVIAAILDNWPLILVGIGILMIFGVFGRGRGPSGDHD